MTTTNARDLASSLADLLRREHLALADFLLALAEFDRLRGWRQLGYAGLFPFLHRELGLSKAAAFFRKTAAELIQRFPQMVDPLRDGRLCLTSVVEVSKVLTADNLDAVLPRFFHCSKQEAKAVTAELRPVEAPAHRAVVTVLPTPPQALSTLSTNSDPARHTPEPVSPEISSQTVRPGEPLSREGTTAEAFSLMPSAPSRDETIPLTADLRRLHVTVSKRFLDKLEAARSALSHSLPGATTEAILEAALDLVLARDAKRKGLVAKPRPAGPTPPPGSRHVPAAVRRAVWERDGGRCQWPLASGGICGSTVRVEIDHVDPLHRGGRSIVENTRLLCRAHNDLAARQHLGHEVMDRFTHSAWHRIGVLRGEPASETEVR
jgi:hypothetical protein